MYDEASAKPSQAPSQLTQLIEAQEKTKALLNKLSDQLQPVTSPHPVDAKDRLTGGYHVSSALSTQHDINDAINYIIDTLVV